MRALRLPLLILALFTTVFLSACSAEGAPAKDDGTSSAQPSEASPGDAGNSHTVWKMPRISSCDQVGAVVSSYIEGLSLEKDTSYVDAEEISCAWSPADGTISSLTDIRTFSITITESDLDIVNPADAEKYGVKGYFSDPRLDALGGVGLWMDADSAVVGGGSGSVMVPGIKVDMVAANWGQNSPLTRDSMVTTALQLLRM